MHNVFNVIIFHITNLFLIIEIINFFKIIDFRLNFKPCLYNEIMTSINQKNHRLYEVITPYFSECVREYIISENRIYITRCEMSKDGRTLFVFMGFSTYSKEDFLQVKKLGSMIRSYLANLQII